MVRDVASTAFYVTAFKHVTLTPWLGAKLPREGGRGAFGFKFQLFSQCTALILCRHDHQRQLVCFKWPSLYLGPFKGTQVQDVNYKKRHMKIAMVSGQCMCFPCFYGINTVRTCNCTIVTKAKHCRCMNCTSLLSICILLYAKYFFVLFLILPENFDEQV